MSIHDNAQIGNKTKKTSRGSTKNGHRLKAFENKLGKGNADWGDCDPGKLQAVVVGITRIGGAITINLSRDMGAYSITLMLDGDRETLWFNGNAELDEELDTVLGTLDGMQ